MTRFHRRTWVVMTLLVVILLAVGARELVGQAGRPGRLHTEAGDRVAVPWGFPRPELPPPPSLPPGSHPLPLITRMHHARMRTEVLDRNVLIWGSIEVMDLGPSKRYVWLLRASTWTDRQLIHEHHYSDMSFLLGEGQTEMIPAFEDTIRLPRGIYRVDLILYSVPPDWQFDAVKRGEDLKMTALDHFRMSRKVVVE